MNIREFSVRPFQRMIAENFLRGGTRVRIETQRGSMPTHFKRFSSYAGAQNVGLSPARLPGILRLSYTLFLYRCSAIWMI